MSNKPAYAMVFSPHPADPEFGVGGTVARWVKEGKDVVYIIATNGDKASSDPDLLPDKLAKIRESEERKAAKILGVREVIFLGHPDLGLEEIPTLKFKKELLKLFLSYRPEVVMTCDPFNPKYFSSSDHRVLGRAVLDVVWPLAQAPNTYRDLMAEGLKLHRAKEFYIWASGEPNYYSDISSTFDIKMKAVEVHQSQIGPNGSNPDFLIMLKEGNKKAGQAAKCQWAESFYKLDVLQRL
jgi:LmbE family N-acetylglucosaminyl deacetylase